MAFLGQKPELLPAVNYAKSKQVGQSTSQKSHLIPEISKKLVGMDVFIQWNLSLEKLVFALSALKIPNLKLKLISNRGVQVWPNTHPETLCSDSWRCRFVMENRELSPQTFIDLLQAMIQNQFEITQTHHLFLFNGERGYSVLQDE